MSLQIIRRKLRFGGRFNDRLYGFEELTCPTSEHDTHYATLSTRTINRPTAGLYLTASGVESIEDDPAHPGNSWFRVEYEGANYNFFYQQGVAKLMVDGTMERIRVGKDLNGDVMEGPDDSSPNKYYWEPDFKGQNVLPKVRTMVGVATAYATSSISWSSIRAVIGKVNSNTITALGAAANTMLCIRAYIPEYLLVSMNPTVTPIQYWFMYEPSTWPLTIPCSKWREIITQLPVETEGSTEATPVYIKASDPTTTTGTLAEALLRRKTMRLKVGSSANRVVLQETNMSSLPGSISWPS